MFIHGQWPGQLGIHFVASDRTVVDWNDCAAALGPESRLAGTMDHEFISVAILTRGSHNRGDRRVGQFTDALKNVPDLGVFEFQLARIGDVLILAASALGVKFAARRNPVGGGSNDSEEIRGRESLADIHNLHFDPFPGDDKRNEDYKVIEATDAVAAESNGIDFQFEALTGLKG